MPISDYINKSAEARSKAIDQLISRNLNEKELAIFESDTIFNRLRKWYLKRMLQLELVHTSNPMTSVTKYQLYMHGKYVDQIIIQEKI